MNYQLISAEENGAILMMLFIFIVLLIREYKKAEREGLRHIALTQCITNCWLFTLYALDIFSYNDYALELFHQYRIVHLSVNLILLPLGFITNSLQTKRHLFSYKWAMAHMTPFIICIGIGFVTNSPIVYYCVLMAAAIYGSVFLFLCARAAYNYSIAAKNEYSTLEGRSFRWMIIIPILLSFLLPAYAFYLYSRSIAWLIIYQLISILLWGSYNAYTLRMIIDRNRVSENLDYLDSQMLKDEDENENENDNDNENRNGKAGQKKKRKEESFAQRLKKACEDSELYLNEDLNREDLARAMNTNHTYLTRLLQQETGTNFYTYINTLRAKRAKALMLMHPDWTMEMVAINCGYRSRTTFTNAFLRIEGITPLDWKKNQGN